MSGLLRQRHIHHSNETRNDDFNDVQITTIYNPKSKSGVHKLSPLHLLVGLGLVVILYIQFSSEANSSASETNNNLKLITVYPWPVAATIHNIEGQTELLISNDNREAVGAIRTTIGMANSLRRKRRPKSILLKLTSFIARLGSEDSNKPSDGDIELESYGEVKIRQYLLDHGEKCNAAIFQYYGEIIDSIMSAGDDDERINSLWAHAVSLFTWCQFANEDARGYITHGTLLKSNQILEESRLKGIGIVGDETPSSDEMHYSQLFVIPNLTSGAVSSRDLSMEVLQAYSIQPPLRLSPQNPLLFGIHVRDLERWTSERWLHNDGRLDADWLLLK